jgi:hypothetical protein
MDTQVANVICNGATVVCAGERNSLQVPVTSCSTSNTPLLLRRSAFNLVNDVMIQIVPLA